MRETLLGILTLAICGSWGCGPGSFKGTVEGRGLKVADAVFYVSQGSDTAPPHIEIIISDRPDLCDDLKAGRLRKNSALLDILLVRRINGEYMAPDKGPYAISGDAGRIGSAIFAPFDESCTISLDSSQGRAASGTVDVRQLQGDSGGRLEGSFSMAIGQQADQISGTVLATWCDLSVQPDSFSCE
ncbi:MAG TPA: hypothetical protein VH877_14210 [Polyangia bacterium]|nr:hypothetical protein [Polyangia bacterium]